MNMFGLILTTPFSLLIPSKEKRADGYPARYEEVMEFEGLIDHVTGNRRNEYYRINENTTHIIIAEFNEELYRILKNNKKAKIKDNEDVEYFVELPDNPANQNHHLEIEVRAVGQ